MILHLWRYRLNICVITCRALTASIDTSIPRDPKQQHLRSLTKVKPPRLSHQACKHILNDLFRVMTVTEQLRAEALQTALPLCKGLRAHCARNTTDWLACSENTR